MSRTTHGLRPSLRQRARRWSIGATVGVLRLGAKLPGGRRSVGRLIAVLPIAPEQRAALTTAVRPVAKRGIPVSHRLRHVTIRSGVGTLRWLLRSGLPGSRRLVEAAVDRLPLGEARRDALVAALLAGSRAGVADADLVNLAAFRRRITDRWNRSGPAEDLRRLAGHRRIHVFLEQGASFPRALLAPEFATASFAVYAFDDRQADLDAAGIGERARAVSIRDRFADISPEAEALHRAARRLAGGAMAALAAAGALPDGVPATRVDVLGQGLEDDLAWRLTLLECLRSVLRDRPAGEPAVLMAAGSRLLPAGLPLLLAGSDAAGLWLGVGRGSRTKARRFWRQLEALSAGHAGAAPEPAEDPPVAPIRARLDEAVLLGRQLAARAAAMLGPRPGVIFLHSPVAPAYVETVAALAGRVRAGTPTLLVSCTATSDPRSAPPSAGGPLTLDFAAFMALQAGTLDPPARIALDRHLATAIAAEAVYDGVDLAPFLIPAASDFIDARLAQTIAAYAFGGAVAAGVGVAAALASPGRTPLVRAASAGFVDARCGVPLVDVQALNVLRHAKYLPPVADLAAVIDSVSARIYAEDLGFPAERIRITGTPRNDALRDRVGAIDRARVAAALGLDPAGRERILLASQLQPMERMAMIARPLARLLAERPSAELVVKLHPREGEGRAAAYRAVFAAAGVGARAIVATEPGPAEMIAWSDVVVTIYSNMAREAALAGRDVVAALFTGWEPPIRLDLEGLAAGAHDADAFRRLLAGALAARRHGRPGEAMDSAYFRDNPHLLTGNATAAIDALFAAVVPTAPAPSLPRLGGSDPFAGAASLNVVVEDGVELTDIPPILPAAARVTIFTNRAAQIPAALPADTRLETGGFNRATAASIERAAGAGDRLAELCVAEIAAAFGDTPIGAALSELRYALWVRLRPPLIDAERKAANLAEALARPADGLLAVGRSEAFLADWSAATAGRAAAQVVRTGAAGAAPSDPAPPGTSSNAAALAGWQADRAARRGTPVPTAADPLDPALLAELGQWFDGLAATRFDLPAEPHVVFTTNWALKTVPGTMAPIFDRLGDGVAVTGFNLLNGGQPELAAALGASSGRRALGPADLAGLLPALPGRTAKKLAAVLVARLAAAPELAAAPAHSRSACEAALSAFARTGLAETLGWNAWCRAAFARPAISVACPGRQWHAEIAHIRARAAGAEAMTVQNAYMTGGYAYTRPTGSIVTAIDAWSRDVFVDAFAVDPAAILVSSTPRFDYLAGLRGGDRTAACVALAIDPARPVVLFAAQEGLDPDARAITAALGALGAEAGPLSVVIKLHPRSPAALGTELSAIAAAGGGPHRFVVVQDAPIATALAAADIVITVYSNVGIEAAIVGKPLIVAKFAADELPLPLDRFGIGFVAEDGATLRQGVVSFLTDPGFRDRHAAGQAAYVAANPMMASGGSADLLAGRIRNALARPAAAGLSPPA